MATPCQTFYDQDYLDLNPDVAQAKMKPRDHWRNHGRKEKDAEGNFKRRFNKQCTTPQSVEPVEFLAGNSPVISEPPPPAKSIQRVVITFSDGTSETVE